MGLLNRLGLGAQVSAGQIRARGDELRDARRYAEAAEVYERYLELRPEDFGIWVQRGNCLKESRSFDSARDAYDTAIRIKPGDPDVHLQLGHLLKLQGKSDQALASYERTLELDPEHRSAIVELNRLGGTMVASTSPLQEKELSSRAARYLDIGDLLIFLRDNVRVTGIQRVQSSLVEKAIDNASSISRYRADDVIIGFCDQSSQTIYAVPVTETRDLVRLVKSGRGTRAEIDQLLELIDALKIAVKLRTNDIYVIAGAYWIGDDYASTIIQLKNSGVRLGIYIYDLIPLTHPQFVHESTREAVINKLAEMLLLADFILTISDYVAQEVRAVSTNELNRTMPVLPVPLSHELPEEGSAPSTAGSRVRGLPKDYVLCVCTLEGRKNHALLLEVWLTLNRKHGGRIPTLVLVGKWGWRNEDFRNRLEATRHANGTIVVLGAVSDEELKVLYEGCLFTVFPSFVEGWGLPVGESLAYGKPCIASNTSSIPEVGGDFCRYINPYDPIEATRIIENAIIDQPGLKAWADRIKNEFKARTWDDVTKNFFDQIGVAISALQVKDSSALTLTPGEVHWITRTSIYGDQSASWTGRAKKFALTRNWYPLEHWGAWSSKPEAEISFDTGLDQSTKLRVLLNLRLPPRSSPEPILIVDQHTQQTVSVLPDHLGLWTVVRCSTDGVGRVKLLIQEPSLASHADDVRPLFCGLSAIAFHEATDIAGRLDILEEITFGLQSSSGERRQ